jgi:hypothetical protein
MGSKSKTEKSRIIQFVDLLLPANFKPAKIDKAWDYTCRVCDDDVYDGCHEVMMSDFAQDFAGA